MPGRSVLALLLAALAAAGLAACQRQQDASAIPHTPIPKAAARLSVVAADGRVRYEGVVADAAARDAVVEALESAAPDATGTLAVEPRTQPAPWAAALGPATAALRRSGGRLAFAGRRIALGGDDLTQEQRATLYRRIHRLYPGYELAGAFQGADLRHALPDQGDEAALLEFLNARRIEFHAGTGMLTRASVQAVARAARGLQAAGPAARAEVHVHPEAGGDEAEQRAVARQRADAVLTQLALRGVAPGRLRAVVAAPLEDAKAPVVEFAPFRAEVPDAGADGDGMAAESLATEGPAAENPAAAAEGTAADAGSSSTGTPTGRPTETPAATAESERPTPDDAPAQRPRETD